MKRLRVAQIGIGHDHASGAVQTIQKLKDDFELVAVAMPEGEDTEFADRLHFYKGIPVEDAEALCLRPDIDAIVVETEDPKLTRYALMAAQAGKHVQMDKPGGLSAWEFRALVDTVKRRGTVLHLGYMYRYNPVLREVFAQARAGEYGEIVSVETQMNCVHVPEKRRWLAKFPGGMMFFLGCHLVDLILQICGLPQEVIPLNVSTDPGAGYGCDVGFAVFRYPRGVAFAKTACTEPGGFARRQLVVCGTKKTVEVKPLEMYTDDPSGTELTTTVTTYSSTSWGDRGVTSTCAPYDRYETMLRAFASYVRGEAVNPVTPDYELALYETILAACGAGPAE